MCIKMGLFSNPDTHLVCLQNIYVLKNDDKLESEDTEPLYEKVYQINGSIIMILFYVTAHKERLVSRD